MKKFFVIAAAAVVALASCTKNEVVKISDEISFETMQVSTKGLIYPNNELGTLDVLPADAKFGVFAYVDGVATPLMNDVEIAKIEGAWKANDGNVYIWPSEGMVDFTAYYPSSLAATYNTATAKVSLANVDLGSTIGSQVDPLVAVTNDQDAAVKPHKAVKLVFKHISSLIDLSVVDSTKTPALQNKIVLKKIEVLGVNTKGDYVDGTVTGKGTWTNVSEPATFVNYEGTYAVTTTAAYTNGGQFAAASDGSSAFVVIPEVVTEGAKKIKVTYDIQEFKINGFPFEKKENCVAEIDFYNVVNNNMLQAGKKYIFHIAFSLDGLNNEILFEPVVDGWEVEEHGLFIDAAKEYE